MFRRHLPDRQFHVRHPAGFGNGVQNGTVIASAPAAVNDSITSIYCDYNFPLTNFTFTFPSTTTASVAVVNAAVTPNNILAPGGLNVGDLLLFLVTTAGNGKTAQGTSATQTAAVVAEITGLPNNTTIDFPAATPSISTRPPLHPTAWPTRLPTWVPP